MDEEKPTEIEPNFTLEGWNVPIQVNLAKTPHQDLPVTKLEFEFMPLPSELVDKFAKAMFDFGFKWLNDNGVKMGGRTDPGEFQEFDPTVH